MPFTPTQNTSRSLSSARFAATKSIDLVTPTAAVPMAASTLPTALSEKLELDDWESTPKITYQTFEEDERDGDEPLSYGKRANARSGTASSSLKQLLKGAERRPEKVR